MFFESAPEEVQHVSSVDSTIKQVVTKENETMALILHQDKADEMREIPEDSVESEVKKKDSKKKKEKKDKPTQEMPQPQPKGTTEIQATKTVTPVISEKKAIDEGSSMASAVVPVASSAGDAAVSKPKKNKKPTVPAVATILSEEDKSKPKKKVFTHKMLVYTLNSILLYN